MTRRDALIFLTLLVGLAALVALTALSGAGVTIRCQLVAQQLDGSMFGIEQCGPR